MQSSSQSSQSSASQSSASQSSQSSASPSLNALGFRPGFAAALAPPLTAARVVAHLGERVQLAGATSRLATVSGRLLHHSAPHELPTTGDWVAISDGAEPDQLAVIHEVLPRHTAMIRRAAGRRGQGQCVAANVDVFLIVTSANRDANARRLERYLAAVWDSGARPILVVNKVDLCPPTEREALLAELAAAAPHVDLLTVSAHTGEGVEALLDAALASARGLVPTLALVGMSGVGKSSLVNRLLERSSDPLSDRSPGHALDHSPDRPLGEAPEAPAQQLQHTLPIDDNDRGRHATTRRELFCISRPSGDLVVIDTPGMRSLGLVEDEGGLEASFAEIAALAADCRFADCSHHDEPGCAVRQAIARGELDANRLASLHKLEREIRASEARRDPALAGNAKRRMKTIHVAQRARYKIDPKRSR